MIFLAPAVITMIDGLISSLSLYHVPEHFLLTNACFINIYLGKHMYVRYICTDIIFVFYCNHTHSYILKVSIFI